METCNQAIKGHSFCHMRDVIPGAGAESRA